MSQKKMWGGGYSPEDFISMLMGHGKKEAQQPVPDETEMVPPSAPPEEEGTPAPATPELELAGDSALFELWRKWEGYAPLPPISLADTLAAGLVSEDDLTREKAALQENLERDARRRLDALALLEAAGEGRAEPDKAPPPPAMPAECQVYLSKNGMAAWAVLFPPIGGGPELELEEFGKVMLKSRVTAGIDSSAMAEVIARKRYFTLCLIARGTPVQEGTDGYVTERYPRQRPQGVQTDGEGRVDYRAQRYVQVIEKGEVICDIFPPCPGTGGLRVDGVAVNPRGVKPAKVPKGSNTDASPDGACLVAAMSGHLEFSGSVFQVKPNLDIDGDVDYSTGNIDFRGDVHVRGDVRENFTIRATGTVTIDGLVEGATVEAGRDIIIANGVLGDNKALLKSRGSVRAKYLENCVVYSGGCTYAECIMASRIFSDNRIVVTSGRGTVIGGGLTAAVGIQAAIIGAKSGRETEITLGVLPYVQEELQNIEIDLGAIHKELEELERQLRYIESRQGISDSSTPLAKGRLRRSVLVMKEDKLVRRIKELQSQQPDLSKCRLECGTVYPVTRLTIGTAFRCIEQLWTKCTAVYDAELHEIKFL